MAKNGDEPRSEGRDRPTNGRLVRRHPQYAALLTAEGLSATGDAVFWVGLLVWLLQFRNGTALIALAAVARLAPRVVLGPAGGVIADRYDRRKLLVGLDVVRSALMVGLAVWVAADQDPVLVVAGVLVVYVLATPYRPAFTAGIPLVVGERDAAAANALDGAVKQIMTFLGPLLGTAVLVLGAPSWAFAVNAITFALSSLLLIGVGRLGGAPPGTRTRRVGRSFRAWRMSLQEGIGSIVDQPGLTLTVWLVFVFSIMRGFELVLLVLVAEDRLRMGAEGVGILNAAIGVGALCTVPFVSRVARSGRAGRDVVVSLILNSAPIALLGIINGVTLACMALVAVGIGVVIFEVLAVTITQRISSVAQLGRVFGIQNMALNGGKLVGALLGPLLVSLFSLEWALLAAAVLVSGSAVVAVPGLLRVARQSNARRDALAPIVGVLDGLALFDGTSEPALERLAGTVTTVAVGPGTEVVREGDHPDDLFVIRSGAFSVVKGGVPIATLGPDDCFGEIGLLREVPRTATVVATEAAEVWRIGGVEFLVAINESAAPPAALLESVSTRLAEQGDVDP